MIDTPDELDFEDKTPNAMTRLLVRLFADETPKTSGNGAPQTPAFECQLILKSGYKIAGALSMTPEGALRLLMLADYKTSANAPATPIMAEHYFDISAIETVILLRKLPQPESSLILPGH